MAILIKSDTTVVNADRDFDYYTSHGLTDKNTAMFVKGLEDTGYTLSTAEFAAVETFKDNLIDKRLWDDVYEVYPMMGHNAAAAGVKLKSLTGESKMLPQYGLDDGYFEYSEGKVLGKKVTETSSSTQPSFNTQLKVSELPSKYIGFHFYMGQAVLPSLTMRQPVMGTKASTGSANTDYSYVAINVNTDEAFIRHISFAGQVAGIGNSMAVYSFLNTVGSYGVSTIPKVYRNGELVGANVAAAFMTPPPLSGEIPLGFLGSSAPFPSTAGSSNAYSGKVRFGCITSGELNDAQVKSINDEIATLLSALGKTA